MGTAILTAVYSDDPRSSGRMHEKGIHHFYFKDYTEDYVASTSFELVDRDGNALNAAGPAAIGMKNFCTTQTQAPLANGSFETVLCFVHRNDAAVLSVGINRSSGNAQYQFEALLRREIKTDQTIRLASLNVQDNIALAVWSNGATIAVLVGSAPLKSE